MNKRGVTLIEVLVVVIIMGVLAGLGVANLQQAVRNTRIKDAAMNTAAFLERVANDANRLNMPLCVKVDQTTKKTITAYRSVNGSCNNPGDKVAEMTLDSDNKFVVAEKDPTECTVNGMQNYVSNTAVFAPRLGLSAAPSGCWYVRYGGTEHYGVAIKAATRNNLTYMLSYDGAQTWMAH
ncbi:MAG: prepilin-type N-terminal cleavage/methylation domain-containing protein [Fibrobacter sp.]|nr:prepilin-type N-terminal cleavage/methylation domain-containing protein [Fibrobacter sp.]